ncbi:methionyl-tRNA formyltransferase [Patescibacteria group bacterium]|nr:methionyl-tRNA formyltransferase [Patescibacteria group bacterium]MBU1519487.1 methionyl-tRNA formyltransferase [Patescibacteria group bacterium]MBU2461066.1 methionyl-tRNA formyltransferase [Patescibacteria group bacterium]
MKNINDLNIAFFGSPQMAVYVLDALLEYIIKPNLIISQPDKRSGRGLLLTPPPVKIWAEKNKIPVFQPNTLTDKEIVQTIVNKNTWDLFIVAAYGKIIPQSILDIPKYGTLNVHPSLLPRLRGASPIQSAILEENETGITIMLMDEQMDHGPIIAQQKTLIANWPPKASELMKITGAQGGKMLAEIIPEWIENKIQAQEQDHTNATFTKKITKENGLINLSEDPLKNFRKIQAFNIWPRAYFYTKNKKSSSNQKTRIIITEATLKNKKLIIKKVIPEGKKEIDYKIFSQQLNSQNSTLGGSTSKC